MKLIGAHVEPEMLAELDRIAEARGVERSKIIRWALAEYIQRFLLPECTPDRTNGRPAEQPEPANI